MSFLSINIQTFSILSAKYPPILDLQNILVKKDWRFENRMRKKKSVIFMFVMVLLLGITTGCTSLTEEDYAMHEENHEPMPDNISLSAPKLQEVYGLAVNYPKILEKVPCYCGCDKVGHENNLECYIGEMDGQNVKKWDPHGAV